MRGQSRKPTDQVFSCDVAVETGTVKELEVPHSKQY